MWAGRGIKLRDANPAKRGKDRSEESRMTAAMESRAITGESQGSLPVVQNLEIFIALAEIC